MNHYEDFQILTNQEYSFLCEQYQNFHTEKPFSSLNKKEVLIKLYTSLNENSLSALHFNHRINKQTSSCIKDISSITNKISTNISSLFSLNINPTQINIKPFNIFSFLKNVNKIILLIYSWINMEKRDHIKLLAQNHLEEIIDSNNKLLSTLEISEFHLFKHM